MEIDVTVEVFARTDVGKLRTVNEDNFLLLDLSTKQSDLLLPESRIFKIGKFGCFFAVADGVGGMKAGKVASSIAVDVINKNIIEHIGAVIKERDEDLINIVINSIVTANSEILEKSRKIDDYSGMGTTLTASLITGKKFYFFQVGDSRAYIFRNGYLTQLTEDQTVVEMIKKSGMFSENLELGKSQKNIITQALGLDAELDVALTTTEIKNNDLLLICSDGLTDMVDDNSIKNILSTNDDIIILCRELTESANENGGKDNITVVLAKFSGKDLDEPFIDKKIEFETIRKDKVEELLALPDSSDTIPKYYEDEGITEEDKNEKSIHRQLFVFNKFNNIKNVLRSISIITVLVVGILFIVKTSGNAIYQFIFGENTDEGNSQVMSEGSETKDADKNDNVKNEIIKGFLAKAEIAFEDNRLTKIKSGHAEDDFALYWYKKVLAVDSQNAEAQEGRIKIKDKLFQLAATQAGKGNFSKAIEHCESIIDNFGNEENIRNRALTEKTEYEELLKK